MRAMSRGSPSTASRACASCAFMANSGSSCWMANAAALAAASVMAGAEAGPGAAGAAAPAGGAAAFGAERNAAPGTEASLAILSTSSASPSPFHSFPMRYSSEVGIMAASPVYIQSRRSCLGRPPSCRACSSSICRSSAR